MVHIAGTNGKGSTLAFLAGIFRESGYRAGRHVSPGIFCYEERFPASMKRTFQKKICAFIWKNKENFGRDGERRDVTSDNV